MMIRSAKVVRVDGVLKAELIRSEACAKCGACQHGRTESMFYPLPKGNFTEGDTVEISLPDEGAFVASLIAYGIPLLCMILGLGLGFLLGLPELLQAALALGALAVGYFVLKALEPRIKRSGKYSPRYPCADETKNGGTNHGN